MACCGYLISNENVSIYTTHIEKVIAKPYSFALRRKITEKQCQVRNFAEVRDFAGHRCSFKKQTPGPARASAKMVDSNQSPLRPVLSLLGIFSLDLNF